MNDDEWRFEGACPTQGHGRASNGAPFYFRARHGSWTLQVGEPGWPVDYVQWPSDTEDIAEGDDGSSGYMDFDTARALVVALLAAHFNEPLSGTRVLMLTTQFGHQFHFWTDGRRAEWSTEEQTNG